VRQLAWLTVYPTTDLREQHLPALPLTRVMDDSLGVVGELDFTGLTVRAPVQIPPDTRFDLVGDTDWFALAARRRLPDARTKASGTGHRLSGLLPRRQRQHVERLRKAPAAGPTHPDGRPAGPGTPVRVGDVGPTRAL
jgi:hypothetical protein